jgi:hypothetical protein
VLEEAENPRVPLLERVRFVSISAGNLDEFYTVRVAGLRELALEGNTGTSDDGRTPAEQLKLINADARRLMQHQQAAWVALRKELEREGITVVTRSALKAGGQETPRGGVPRPRLPGPVAAGHRPGASRFPSSPTRGSRWRCRCGARGTGGRCRRCCRSPARSTVSCACPRPMAARGSCRWRSFCC